MMTQDQRTKIVVLAIIRNFQAEVVFMALDQQSTVNGLRNVEDVLSGCFVYCLPALVWNRLWNTYIKMLIITVSLLLIFIYLIAICIIATGFVVFPELTNTCIQPLFGMQSFQTERRQKVGWDKNNGYSQRIATMDISLLS